MTTKNILIYDLATLPKTWTMMQVRGAFQDGIVLWCSAGNNNISGRNIDVPPRVIDKNTLEDAKEGLKFIDTADLTEEQINELKKDE